RHHRDRRRERADDARERGRPGRRGDGVRPALPASGALPPQTERNGSRKSEPDMTWQQRHRIRAFLSSSLWPIPLASLAAALPLPHLVFWIDRRTGWTLNVSIDGARAVAGLLAGSLLSFIVFVFSVLLVAVQLASAQLTPRIIARVFKDRFTRFALGVF